MSRTITPKQLARAIDVSESSVKRWCDRGLIPTVRTAGGHRRLPIGEALEYVRRSGRLLAHPEVLGLPTTSGSGERLLKRRTETFRQSLLSGDEKLARAVLLDLFMAGIRVSVLCDQVIAAAFRQIGEQWACGEAEIYQERRACEICTRLLHELGRLLPAPGADWTALGGTAAGDHYTLPTAMAEVVLHEAGWNARSLGTGLPFETLIEAVLQKRPRLFWLSVSHIPDEEHFLREFPKLSSAAARSGSALVVGGQAMTENIRQQLQYAAYCDTMQHLQSFAKTLSRSAAT